MSATADTLSPILEEQVTAARARRHRMLMGREAFGRTLMLVIFVATSLAFFVVVISAPQVLTPVWEVALSVCDFLGIDRGDIANGGGLFQFWDRGR